ncbi:MAG: protoporphyrinogen oxidase [Chlamydiales bacterium]|nr:protoporphyrinogen oxidase [Chlamydiales bacterium]
MKKIVIAGGGISGLSARYFLSKRYPEAEIVLYEESGRLGGCIETSTAPYFFERGPRTFKVSRADELLSLVKELGLEDELLYSDRSARRRYLYKNGKLHRLGLPFLLPFLPALLREWKQPYSWGDDESIATFVTRRFGRGIAETLFDPLTQGIFAGDIHHLSIRACFPELKAMEEKSGSITRALMKRNREKKGKGLVTLKGGLQVLVDRLVEAGRGEIHLNTPLSSLDHEQVVLALPSRKVASLFPNDQEVQTFFDRVEEKTIHVVNVAYSQAVLKRKGFGYLIPSSEKEKVMGVVFDSSIFPEQNQGDETRLTVMLREGNVETALEGLRRHLGITKHPANIEEKVWKQGIPQYGVGHLERVDRFEAHLKKHYPHVRCMGNFLRGVSVNHCIAQSNLMFKI